MSDLDQLDKQLTNLKQRGVSLAQHPARARLEAHRMHRMAKDDDLRSTVLGSYAGPQRLRVERMVREGGPEAAKILEESQALADAMGTKRLTSQRIARRREMEQRQIQRTSSSLGGIGTSVGGDAVTAIPRFYDPLEYFDLTGVPWNMADEGHRHKLHKWLRLYYATHYLVPILIDIFTRFPLVGMEMESKDQKLADFYENAFMNKLDYPNFLVSLGREFWTVGEAFALGSFDEDLGVWEREELLNPEDVIIKNFPLLGSKQMLIVPPEYLKKLAQEKAPAKEYRQLEINFPELIPYLKRNEHIPVSGVLLKQVANKLTDWDDHGTPILLRGLRTLMHEEKLLASQDAIAERLYSPFILAKLGIMDLGDGQPPWIPDSEQLEMVRDDIDVALSSDFRLLVHHFGLDVENVFGREQMPRLGDDFDRIEHRIMQVFGVNPSLLSAGNATQPYASSALQAEFLNQILRTFQDYLKAHFEARAYVVAEAQEHYDYEMRGQTKVPIYEEVVVYDDEGNKRIETRPKLLIPELKFQTLDLRDEATERQFLQSLRAMGVPISDKKMMVGVGFDIDDQINDYNEELVIKTVAQQEAKMKTYTILREKNLPIPPDLKAEVEAVLHQPQSPGQLPSPGGPPAATGPGAPMAPTGEPGPTGGPGESIVMPTPPAGLLGPQPGMAGPPPAGPGGALGPGGGTTAPPVSMERRQGLPRPAKTQTSNSFSERSGSPTEQGSLTSTDEDDGVEAHDAKVPDKLVRELPQSKIADTDERKRKYRFVDEE